jgi:hypothetical protein
MGWYERTSPRRIKQANETCDLGVLLAKRIGKALESASELL